MFREAVKQMFAIELRVCPKCGDMDKPRAKPTLERQQNGSLLCLTCFTNFYPPKENA